MRTAAAPVRLPTRHCSMYSVPLLDGELDVHHVAVVAFERAADLHQLARRRVGLSRSSSRIGSGVRVPATTSSPCAFMRNSP